ncbi:transcription repressor OFP7-like [Phoenix dactylifera]|uniref:Transcription repressor n=1 Tax=Phoenix dactylifera TaxID=42345 RepID=A0A8B7MXF8_PHODC|nr:transcription repressor OFP7-like [Phoenix dactylifera]
MASNGSSSRLKQRLVRMFKPSSLLRSSCNGSTSGATILSSTGSSRTLLRDVAPAPVFVPRHHRHRGVDDDDDGMFLTHDSLGRSLSSSIANDRRRHAAPVLPLSIDCGGCRPTRDRPPLVAKREKGRHGKNKKRERRVRETGGFYETGEGEGRMCPPASPSSPSKSSCYYYCFDEVEKKEKKEEKNKKKQKKKKLLSNSYGFSSTSSADSVDGFEFFTSEEREVKEETEAFFSSRSFSSDSSEFYQRPNNKKKKNKKKPSRCPPRRRTKNHENRIASEGFQPLVSIASREKKARKLEEEEKSVFAVVKRSRDPYGDFRSSMVEMIMERQIFGAEDLEKLLHYYLALNSPHHHPNILHAFSEILVVIFGN